MRKKIRNCMAILAGTAMLFACSDNNNDGITPIETVDGDEASLVLKLSNQTSTTRALDNLNGDLTQDILKVDGTVNVFFFTATGNLVAKDAPQAAALTGTGKMYDNATYSITTAVKEVVIVGNVGNITASVTNKTSLQSLLSTLEDAQADYDNPDIWVYGSTTDINWDAYPAVGDVKQGECKLELNPVLARINVTVKTSGITKGYVPGDLSTSNVDFKGVAVLYSGAYTHYIPSFIPTMSELTSAYGSSVKPMRSGIMDSSYPLWDGSTQVSLLAPSTGNESILNATWLGQWNGQANLDNGTFTRTFYAFPTSTQSGYYDRNTIVTVYGDFNSDPGQGTNVVTPLFWAVHFSNDQVLNSGNAKPLENGNVYNLTINLTGDYSDGGPGTVDPETPPGPANLNVIIEQVKWKAIINMEIDFEG